MKNPAPLCATISPADAFRAALIDILERDKAASAAGEPTGEFAKARRRLIAANHQLLTELQEDIADDLQASAEAAIAPFESSADRRTALASQLTQVAAARSRLHYLRDFKDGLSDDLVLEILDAASALPAKAAPMAAA